MAPKRKGPEREDKTPKPPDTGRVLRSSSRKLKDDTPGSDAAAPPPLGRVQRRGGVTKPKKPGDILRAEGLNATEVEEALEQERGMLLQSLTAAERAASIDGFEDHMNERARIKYTVPKPPNLATLMRKINAAVGVAANFEPPTRWRKHLARVEATAMYEDSLYFRVPERRKHYREHIDEEGNIIKRPIKRGAPAALWMDTGYGDELRATFESYERHYVGMTEETNVAAIGPRELHLRVPTTRRTLVGLGQPHPATTIAPINLRFNTEAIEARRREVEDDSENGKNVATDGTPMEETHTERRAREVELIGHCPTSIYVSETIPTARNVDRMKLDSGLLLSAGETSYDWNESYDQMDIVKLGSLAAEPHMIDDKDARKLVEKIGIPADSEEEEPQGSDAEGVMNEFSKTKRPHRRFELRTTTPWAEEMYGRREREHAYMDIRPPSPVLSPPHSPIFPSKTAAGTLHIPVDVSRDHPNFKEYRSSFKDQYSVNFRDWPHFKTALEGKGRTVIYEPLDIPSLPDRQQELCNNDPVPLDERGRFAIPAPQGTGMRLLREALRQPYEEPIRPELPGRQVESDDEGDLFRQSYLEGSGD
jgi:hypothetical protein